MLFNALFPQIMQIVADVQKWLFKRMDQSWAKGNDADYKTKCTQVSQYIKLYSGDDYIVHFRYSGLLTTAYVTMLYGVGMPVLFPIAAFTYGCYWIHEKYHMAYNYVLPPTYDDRLTENMIQMLRWSPIMLLLNGYWMLDNQQMFKGYINPIATSTDYMKTGHTFNTLSQVSQASPLLLIGIAITIIFFMQTFMNDLLIQWGFGFSAVEIEVDENLPNFFRACKIRDSEWYVAEDAYYQEKYAMDLIEDDLSKKLDALEGPPKAPIQGIHWYAILANPYYSEQFAYIPLDVPNRSNLIVDDDDNEENDCEQSDMVSLILNLAFVSDGFVKDMVFETGISTQLRGYMLGQRALANLATKIKDQSKLMPKIN